MTTGPVRVRFAPSPTGYLHVGGARTALFNWLFARHEKGVFVLRIEDTDRERSTDDSVRQIVLAMEWLGLDWDEGPILQSERAGIHRAAIEQLLDSGHAYRCWCTPEELEAKRQRALAEKRDPHYDGTCRDRADRPDRPYTVRLRIPEGQTELCDLIRGTTLFQNREIDDFIIARADGSPTYNFTVVVDDADMRITHVIRGDDHYINTPKQIVLYRALGLPLPLFAHLPMLLGSDKKRLSKRHGAAGVQDYRDLGYLPAAIVNYLARLGWSAGDRELFSREELVEAFTLDHVGSSPGVFNPEKLDWVSQQWIQRTATGDLAGRLVPFLAARGIEAAGDRRLPQIVESLKVRARTIAHMAEMAACFFGEEAPPEPDAEKLLVPAALPAIAAVRQALERSPEMDRERIEALFRETAERLGVKMGKVAQPVRAALTGRTFSPGIDEVVSILGPDRAVARLKAAEARIAAAREVSGE